jgi:hypothetical protein
LAKNGNRARPCENPAKTAKKTLLRDFPANSRHDAKTLKFAHFLPQNPDGSAPPDCNESRWICDKT